MRLLIGNIRKQLTNVIVPIMRNKLRSNNNLIHQLAHTFTRYDTLSD